MKELENLLHLVDRGVEGRLLPAEGDELKRALTILHTKVTRYEEVMADGLKAAVDNLEKKTEQPKPKLQLPAESF